MTHRATPRFWRCYQRLPQQVRQLQAKNESKAVLDVFEELASNAAGALHQEIAVDGDDL